MEDVSDRERLEKLAHKKQQAREREAAETQETQKTAAKRQADLLAVDRTRTTELFEYCKRQLAGFKLVPTGHEVAVGMAPSSRMLGIQADGVEFVTLHTTHWSHETNDFEGQIPLLYARFRNGKYQIMDADGRSVSAPTFDDAREKLIEIVSNMDLAFMKRLFEKVRERLASR